MKKAETRCMKQCTRKLQASGELRAVAWSDLDMDLVGEIKKKPYCDKDTRK